MIHTVFVVATHLETSDKTNDSKKENMKEKEEDGEKTRRRREK